MEWLLAFLGFAIFIVMGMAKTKAKHATKQFNVLTYLKDEVFTLILAILSVVTLMLVEVDIRAIINPEYSKLVRFIYVAIGFLNYSMFTSFMNIVVPKKFREE